MTAVAVSVAFICGLLIGSFLNVVIHRVPRHESIVSPGSSCPSCGTAIAPYDNVPVFSWILLRGRCRRCKAAISVRYPLTELVTGAAFSALTFAVAASGQPFGWAVLLCFLVSAVIGCIGMIFVSRRLGEG